MDILDTPEHLLDDATNDDRPEQVIWAKLDHIEDASRRGPVAILDGVDASWFDSRSKVERGWLTRPEAESGEHVSILTVALERVAAGQRWHRVVLGPGRSGAPLEAQDIDLREMNVALQYDSLLGLPAPRPLTELRPATRAEAARLGAAGSLSRDRDAPDERVRMTLEQAGTATSAAVMDVGQGNWNALLRGGVPVLLFDVGGGVLSHLRSFPAGFTSFCLAEHPVVVLSHWDWDHWSSALRFPESQSLVWIVPRQGSLGPTHARFLAALRTQGIVLVFPAGNTIVGGAVELQQAQGRASSVNETGLAMLVRNDDKSMLFPGDAGYATLDLPKTLTSVVVPHHGGRSESSVASLPTSDGDAAGRAAISYAEPNHFRHPTAESVALHDRWAADFLHTKDRGPAGEPGHIELHWTASATATPPCCPASALPLRQR